MRHLKMDVLRELQERGEVQKVHTKRQISHAETSKPGKPKKPESSQTQGSSLTDAWVWRFTQTARSNPLPTEPTDAEPPAVVLEKSEPKTHLMMYPVPENNHLNTRRRNARPAKEKRDRAWATEIRKVMSEGAKEARASSNVA
ncbi:hypothetical protein FRC03_000627 [Tulasnella sp. 419]|nr:hypothetical protein FRC03_000627 [Tulasnella sp. 419]